MVDGTPDNSKQVSPWFFGKPLAVEHGMYSLSLSFVDPRTEQAYVANSSDRLALMMVRPTSIGFVFYCAMIGFHFLTDPQDIFLRDAWLYSLGAFVVILVNVHWRFTRLMSWMGVVPCEWLAIFEMAGALASCVLLSKWYYAKLLGIDVSVYSVHPSTKSDGALLLALDAFVTLTHVAFPIRWKNLVFLEVWAFLSYLIPVLLFDSPENASGVVVNMIWFILLLSFASLGKRILEYGERIAFLQLIREKSLRVQTEFRLGQLQEDLPKPADLVSEAFASVQESALSMPPTTRTDRIFEDDHDIRQQFRAMMGVGVQEQWLIDEREIELGPQILGKGGFGVVVIGQYAGTEVAVKAARFKPVPSSRVELHELCNELRILRRVRHPNIVNIYGACLDQEGDLALVLELLIGIVLRDWVLATSLRDPHADRQILADVCSALCFLHSRQPRIVHGDLKDTNIFVEKFDSRPLNCRGKLLDFGCSRLLTKRAKRRGRTFRWAAPEVVTDRYLPPYASSDVYSFGLVCFFVFASDLPWAGHSCDDILAIFKGSSSLPNFAWPSAIDLPQRHLVETCCAFDRFSRPRIKEVLATLSCARCGHSEGTISVTLMLERVRRIVETPEPSSVTVGNSGDTRRVEMDISTSSGEVSRL